VTATLRVVIIPGDQPEKEINVYGRKDFEKKENFKTSVENVTRNVNKRPRSEYDDGEELGDDEGLN